MLFWQLCIMNMENQKKYCFLPRKFFIGIYAAIILILGGLLYLSFFDRDGVKYITDSVRCGNIESNLVVSGIVEPFHLVTIGSQASGQVKRIFAETGQKVKKGTLIAEIDSTTQENDLAIQESLLRNYKSQLTARKMAETIALKKFQREKRLLNQDATSQEDFDTAQNELAQAKANVADMLSLIQQTEISVKTAKANLAYTKIIAPIDGTIIKFAVEEGQTINASQQTPTIAYIADLSKMALKLKISEVDITKIEEKMVVSFNILSLPEKIFKTRIESIDPVNVGAIFSSSTSQNFKDNDRAIYYNAKGYIDNHEGLLRINMTAQCSISIDKKENVLLVQRSAIENKNGKYYVSVVSDGKIVEKEIKIGLIDNVFAEVVSGLRVGESIVIEAISNKEINAMIDSVQ